MTYAGWANYDTWNVVLWLSNDEPTYQATVDYFKAQAKRVERGLPTDNRYLDLIAYIGLTGEQTPDGVEYNSDSLDLVELDEWVDLMVQETIAYA